MQFDFDQVSSRRRTKSIKWDYLRTDGQLLPRSLDENPDSSEEVIPLGLSDMDFPTAPPIQAALHEAVSHGVFGYTRPDEAYNDAICQWMTKRYQWSVDADWILTTTGTMQSIILAIQTLTERDDGIIIQPPLFGPIGQAITYNDRRVITNPLFLSDGHYSMDFDDLRVKAAQPNNKMLILCHPHNPVGRIWTADEIKEVGEICRQHELILVTDEVHGELSYSWSTFQPVGKIEETLNERLVVCTGPSKAFNLPGLRVSLAIIPNPVLREKFIIGQRNLNELFGYNMMGILALQAAYEGGGPWLDAVLSYLESNYLYLQEFLRDELPQIRLIPAEGLYLVWLDCRGISSDERELKKLFLEKAKVDLDWGSQFGSEGTGFVRLNIACPRALLQTGLARLKAVLN